jgi:hypothetical protein
MKALASSSQDARVARWSALSHSATSPAGRFEGARIFKSRRVPVEAFRSIDQPDPARVRQVITLHLGRLGAKSGFADVVE